jgi:F-type H+-transporting ATPase subunit b
MMLHSMLAAAGEATGNPAKAIADQFGWNAQAFLSQVVLFVILAVLLRKFAYAPLLGMLEKRRQQISEGIENAEKTRVALAQAETRAAEIISQAGQQANRIIEEARGAAVSLGEQERQRSVAEAQRIIAKAQEAGEAELARLKNELRREFGRLVVQAASRSAGDVLTVEQKGRLSEDAVRQLSA